MLGEALPPVDMIKEEVDVEEQNIPHSWDSGVALDTVTALQMAEFQKVVDNLHRQVAPQTSQPPPPPYPYTVTRAALDNPSIQSSSQFPNETKNRDLDTEIEQVYLTDPGIYATESKPFGSSTFQAAAPRLENIAKTGSQSLPTNVTIRPKVIDRIEHKHNSSQRSESVVLNSEV